jgi:hypothetical protein
LPDFTWTSANTLVESLRNATSTYSSDLPIQDSGSRARRIEALLDSTQFLLTTPNLNPLKGNTSTTLRDATGGGTASKNYEAVFRSVLSTLWKSVVKPVVRALGLEVGT